MVHPRMLDDVFASKVDRVLSFAIVCVTMIVGPLTFRLCLKLNYPVENPPDCSQNLVRTRQMNHPTKQPTNRSMVHQTLMEI